MILSPQLRAKDTTREAASFCGPLPRIKSSLLRTYDRFSEPIALKSHRPYQTPYRSLQSLSLSLGTALSILDTIEAMHSLFFACLISYISVVFSLNIIPQDSIAVSADTPTLGLLSPSSQSTSWPTLSFSPARPPSQAANVSALKALGLDTDEPVYWETAPSGNVLVVQCHVRYGRRLDYQDCRDAYSYIPRSDARIARFAERYTGRPFEIALPQRNLGSMSSPPPSPENNPTYRETLLLVNINVADRSN